MTSRYLASSWRQHTRRRAVSNRAGISHDPTPQRPEQGESSLTRAETYRAKSNGGSGQAYQASVPCMRVVDGIGKVIAELVDDGLDPGVVLLGD